MARAARAHRWPMRGKVDGVSTKGVRGIREQGDVCHGSPRRSGIDEKAESGMDGSVPMTVESSRGLAVIR
jgi:hypothetical protein